MVKFQSYRNALGIALLALTLLAFTFKFNLFSKKEYIPVGATLEIVVNDFNKKPIHNASITLYRSLKDYQNNTPILIDNWETIKNHYRIMSLSSATYYFKVEYSGLDNSSDIYCTNNKLEIGNMQTYNVTLR